MDDLLLATPSDAQCIGILTRLSRADTLAYVRDVARGREVAGAPFCDIPMPCGERLVIQAEADFPGESVPCRCGSPLHWFIKYEKGEE